MRRASVRELVVVIALCAVTLGGAVAAMSSRDADDEFLQQQEDRAKLSAGAVEDLMLGSPDPNPPHRSGGTSARCVAEGRRDLRNPWTCTVRYPSGSVAHYTVTINPDGSYFARYANGQATARGCCLEVPGSAE
jgi:hypothetical protein